MRTVRRRPGRCSWLSRGGVLLRGGGAVSGEGEVRGRVLGDRSTPFVIYARDMPEIAALPQARATVKQLHLRFLPQVLPILQGTTVEFVNEDSTAHNVFSPTAHEPFDLGTFGEGTRTHLSRTPGSHAMLCNVHVEMVASILVLPNHH